MTLVFPSLSSPWDGSAHTAAEPSLLGETSGNTFGCASWVTLKPTKSQSRVPSCDLSGGQRDLLHDSCGDGKRVLRWWGGCCEGKASLST